MKLSPLRLLQQHEPSSTYLDHEEVLIDNTIVREATHWGDVLVSHIKLCAALVAVLVLLAHPVHLLVHLCSVVETHLTRASNCPGHTGWMPCTNAGNLHIQGPGHLLAQAIIKDP